MPPFQNDHDIVDCERFVDALAGRVASASFERSPGQEGNVLAGKS